MNKVTIRILVCAMIPFICILLGYLAIQVGIVVDIQQVRNAQTKWKHLSIKDYTMKVEIHGTYPKGKAVLTVRKGLIVDIENSDCFSCVAADYQRFTVDSLLTDAINCGRECVVNIDPTYGYVSFMTWAAVLTDSNFSIRVSNFQKLL